MRTYRVEKGERKHKNQTNIRFWCETKGRIHYIFGANRPQYVYFSFFCSFFLALVYRIGRKWCNWTRFRTSSRLEIKVIYLHRVQNGLFCTWKYRLYGKKLPTASKYTTTITIILSTILVPIYSKWNQNSIAKSLPVFFRLFVCFFSLLLGETGDVT